MIALLERVYNVLLEREWELSRDDAASVVCLDCGAKQPLSATARYHHEPCFYSQVMRDVKKQIDSAHN